MPTSLPERPDLAQLRRRAKALRDAARGGDAGALARFARHRAQAPHGPVTLAAAQLVIAREVGFASWPRLKAAVDAVAAAPDQRAEAFVAASVERRLREAAAILAADPDIAARSLNAAAVLGAADRVRVVLAADPSAAVAIDAGRGWPPLLYVCYSRWHEVEPSRSTGMAEVARLLLDAGASPNTNNGARRRYRSALRGSVEVNHPALTKVLLEAGANPDDGQCIGEAAGCPDHHCLELLLAHGARVAGTWAIDAAVHADAPRAVALLAEALRAAGGDPAPAAREALPDAATNASAEVVAALLVAGADPNVGDEAGRSALRLAARAGKDETAAYLIRHGAADDRTAIDHFLGACRRADRSAAEQLLAEHPDLPGRLTDDDRAAVVQAAASGPVAAVALMLGLGFSPHARNRSGEQPLHRAAYGGKAETARLLIAAGADLDARDAHFDGTPLAYAAVGSGECAGRPGDWMQTVRLLLEAGAARAGAWISGKPPSEEVASLLRSYGVTPDAESEPQPDERADQPRSTGDGIMADLAHHLEVAYRLRDLDLLGSLLHPRVRWGPCSTVGEVLDWCRRMLADGTRPTIESVEVDRDAVLVGVSVARQAEGARPEPAERRYQAFTVVDAQIVEIRGYADRASALART